MNAPTPRPARGRIPSAENAPPPPWFGLSFALAGGGLIVAGVAGVPGMAGAGGLVMIAFGLFFGSLGVALTLTTIRAERARMPVHQARQPDAVDAFTRSPIRILVDLVLGPFGGIGFVGLSIVLLGFGPPGWIGSVVFCGLGIFVLRGAAVTVRRGWRRTIVEVGPDGIRIPELPRRLAWDEIDHLDVEDVRGAGADGTARYRRLGIWPLDPTLTANAPGRAEAGVVRTLAGFANRLVPDAGISDPSKIAPYGVWAYEVEQEFSELLRSVGRYAPIVGVPDDAGASLATVQGLPVPPAAATDGVVGAILENLAQAGGAPMATPGSLDAGTPASGSGPLGAAPGAALGGAPSRTFGRLPGSGSVSRLLGDASWSAFMIGVPAVFLGPQLVIGSAVLGNPLLWGFDLVAVAFIGFGIGSLLELPGRWRMARGDPALVAVDERGLEMRGMGRLAWSEIADARIVASSIPTQEGRPSIRRLEIVPLDPARLRRRPWSDRAYDRFRALTARLVPFATRRRRGGAFALDLDLLEDPEGLLDTIARYRLVDGS